MEDKKKTDTLSEIDQYVAEGKSGNDFTLIVIMISLILFSVSAWLGFGQLSDFLSNRSVRISIPEPQPARNN